MRRLILIAVAAAALAAPGGAGAATLEQVGTFTSPVFVSSDPDDPNRLYVVEQSGRIVIRERGRSSTLLDLTGRVRSGGEEGLLSMAFAPDYPRSGRLYVFYTDRSGNLRIDELKAAGTGVRSDSRRTVLRIPHPVFANHNGGQLQFGPDGNLYVATGDGGGGGDPDHNAQSRDSLLGKILRIDPRPSDGKPYSVPPGNPFVGAPGAEEIWSYGLRNPWRFSFDRESGALAIGDVGQSAREELNWEPGPSPGRGANFGWSCREGFSSYPSSDPACSGASGFTDPIFDYARGGGNCSITGGYVVRDPELPELIGRYLYADYCRGEVRSLVPDKPTATGDRSEGLMVPRPTSFGEDACARLYVVSHDGPVYRFVDRSAPCALPLPIPGAPKLLGPRRQRLGSSDRISLRLRARQAGRVRVRAAVVRRRDGGKVVSLGGKGRRVIAPGRVRVSWKLRPRQARKVRRALRRGVPLDARFRARAVDGAGARSAPAKLRSRLRR